MGTSGRPDQSQLPLPHIDRVLGDEGSVGHKQVPVERWTVVTKENPRLVHAKFPLRD